jgi:hypothetical protein
LDRNKIIYDNQYWIAYNHQIFPLLCHEMFLCTLLCAKNLCAKNSNRIVSSLPEYVWHLIFSFLQRKHFK